MELVGILGVVLAGMGVVLAATGPIRRRSSKRLEYVITQNQRLLDVPRGVSVEFSVEGRRVEQAFVTVLRVANTGTQDFLSRQWEAPLTVRLPGCSVISAQQIAARPSDFRVSSAALTGDSVELGPFLFNSGDLFELQIVSEGAIPNPQVSARLPGLTQVTRRKAVYNLGNGPDGELIRENKIVYSGFGLVWTALTVLVALGPFGETAGAATSYWSRVPLLSLLVGGLFLYLGFLRWATVRNRRWRPSARF